MHTDHVIDKINQPYHVGELTPSVSTSAGICLFPDNGQDIDTLISHADIAMFQAKQAGRNNYQLYSHEFAAGKKLQLSIEQELKSALSNQRLATGADRMSPARPSPMQLSLWVAH